MRFASKRDTWLGLVLWGSALIPLAGLAYRREPFPVLALVLYGLFIGWIWYGTYYTITGEHLRVSSGPFRQRVRLAEIRSITPSRDPLASPALSMDRLLIKYGRSGFVLVSPLDSRRFREEIKRRCPDALIIE